MASALEAKVTDSAETENLKKNIQMTIFSNALSNNLKNTGRWTSEEHKEFLHGLQLYGKNWKKISTHVRTRTPVQIRTHAQKYFLKRERKRNLAEKKMELNQEKCGFVGIGNLATHEEQHFPGKRTRLNIERDISEVNCAKKIKEDPLVDSLDFDDVAGEAFKQGMDFVAADELFENDPFEIPGEFDVYTPKVTSALDKPFYDFNFDKAKAKHQGMGLHRTLGLHLDPLLGHEISPIPYKGHIDLFDYPNAHDAAGLLFDA